MPELPEVEYAARCLRLWMKGRRIERVVAADTRVLRPSRPRDLVKLAGRRVLGVERHGKTLLVLFDEGMGLFAHLGMTGKFVLARDGAAAPRHSRASFHVPGVGVVHYNDPRLFGRLVAAPMAELRAMKHIRALGPDALAGGAEPGELGPRLLATRRAVKVVLMDQTILAGLGNIQVTEALWRAKLHPLRASSSLEKAEIRRLSKAILRTLRETLVLEDGPEITYVEEPGADNPFQIYGKAGERCPRCRTVIVKKDIGGRTSAFCPKCQRG